MELFMLYGSLKIFSLLIFFNFVAYVCLSHGIRSAWLVFIHYTQANSTET